MYGKSLEIAVQNVTESVKRDRREEREQGRVIYIVWEKSRRIIVGVRGQDDNGKFENAICRWLWRTDGDASFWEAVDENCTKYRNIWASLGDLSKLRRVTVCF